MEKNSITAAILMLLGVFFMFGKDIMWNVYASITSAAARPESWNTIFSVLAAIFIIIGAVLIWRNRK